MTTLPANQLMPGDRFISKGRTWVVLARREATLFDDAGNPHERVQLRTLDSTPPTDHDRKPVVAYPPADLLVEVLNRDDSLTAETAVDNLRAGGLLP